MFAGEGGAVRLSGLLFNPSVLLAFNQAEACARVRVRGPRSRLEGVGIFPGERLRCGIFLSLGLRDRCNVKQEGLKCPVPPFGPGKVIMMRLCMQSLGGNGAWVRGWLSGFCLQA